MILLLCLVDGSPSGGITKEEVGKAVDETAEWMLPPPWLRWAEWPKSGGVTVDIWLIRLVNLCSELSVVLIVGRVAHIVPVVSGQMMKQNDCIHSWGISFLCGKLYVRVLLMRIRDYCWDRLAFISVTLGAVECALFVIFQWDTYLRRALPKERICSGPLWICQKSTIGSIEKRRDDSCESGNDARLRYCLPACSISTWMEWLREVNTSIICIG